MTIAFHDTVELAAEGIELLAVTIMVACILIGTTRWRMRLRTDLEGAYKLYRARLAESLLIGLGLLVAADIIRTVLLDLTLPNIATLGALVVVRTFLGWTLAVEIEGHWPWQSAKKAD